MDKLKIGQKAKIFKINIKDQMTKRRIVEMGITENVDILVKKIAPLGDPISFEIRGYELCLRKDDLSQIEVQVQR